MLAVSDEHESIDIHFLVSFMRVRRSLRFGFSNVDLDAGYYRFEFKWAY